MSIWTDGDLLTPDNLNSKGMLGDFIDIRRNGAAVDGSTDDTTAITTTIAQAVAAGCGVYFPEGSIVTTGFSDSAGRVVMRCAGTQNTIFRYSGSNGGSCIHLTKERSQILGGFSVAPLASQTVTGLLLDGGASRCVVDSYPLFNGCDISVKIDGVYGNEITADIVNGLSKGIHFTSTANANRVQCQEVAGTTASGSIGIHDEGSDNETSGQQLSEWETPISAGAGASHRFVRHFVENNTNGLTVATGTALSFDGYHAGPPPVVTDGGALITPFGFNHPNGLAHVPTTILPVRSLSVFYPFVDNGTTIIADHSGNGRTGTKNGTWASTTGPMCFAIQLASGAYNTIRIPVSAITYNGAWAIALLVQHATWGTDDTNTVFTVFENSNTLQVTVTKDTYNTTFLANSSSAGNFGGPMHKTNIWEWVCVGYDPSGSGTTYMLHPAMLCETSAQSYTKANTLTATPTTIEIGGSTNGTMNVGSVAIWNGRVPSKTEMLHWCNQVTPPAIPAALRILGGNETTGATSVADGGTITHGLGTTPTLVTCTPTTSGEFVSVTAISSTTFTVAIKKHDNSAGTTQTVYWRAVK